MTFKSFFSKNVLVALAVVIVFPTLAQDNNIKQSSNENQSQNKSQNQTVTLNEVSTGSLLFQQTDSQRFVQAPQLKTIVDINIKGIVANVKVKQKFTNTSDEWQHATYVFPLPDNAAVNHLKIKVADRVITGEVQEKKQALKTFNNAKSKGQKAALVEQHRPNLFSTKVANIPPKESIEIELNYFQQVDYEAGEFSLHFPMAITPRYQPNDSSDQGRYSLPYLIHQAGSSSKPSSENNPLIDLTIQLASGAELAQVNSVNHTLIATQQGHGTYALKLMNQPMKKDFKLTWQYMPQALPQVLNFQQTYQDHDYGLLMILPGLAETNIEGYTEGNIKKNTKDNTEINTEVKTKRELTFVLDTSGSMHGQSLIQAKAAFKYALKSLTEHDTFQVISFNSYPTKLFQSPVVSNDTNKQSAWRYVNQLMSTGGTEIKSALALVLDDKSNKDEKLQQVVFLTDGAVGNEADIFSYIAKNIADKRLFTVGLGTAPNRYFMKKAAEIGRGSYQFISNHSELVKEMERLFTKLSHPVLTNLALSTNEPNRELITAPNPIPDVYQGEPLFLSYQINTKQGYNRLGNSAPSVSISGDSQLTGIYKGSPWSLNIKPYDNKPYVNKAYDVYATANAKKAGYQTVLVTPTFEDVIPPLATLWARRKIADHYRSLMLYKDKKSKANIIELALKYQLVTPFTSLVVVEQKVSRPHYLNANAKQLKNNLPAGQKLPSTALNWQWQFYFALYLLFFSAVLMCAMRLKK